MWALAGRGLVDGARLGEDPPTTVGMETRIVTIGGSQVPAEDAGHTTGQGQ